MFADVPGSSPQEERCFQWIARARGDLFLFALIMGYTIIKFFFQQTFIFHELILYER